MHLKIFWKMQHMFDCARGFTLLYKTPKCNYSFNVTHEICGTFNCNESNV